MLMYVRRLIEGLNLVLDIKTEYIEHNGKPYVVVIVSFPWWNWLTEK